MIDPVKLVKDFYDAAGIQHPYETHLKLIEEELSEVKEAVEHLLKELCDLNYVVLGAEGQFPGLDWSVGEWKIPYELIDAFTNDQLDQAFLRVHESNMSKLTDGVLMRDPETGKILKGPNYKAPDLSDLV